VGQGGGSEVSLIGLDYCKHWASAIHHNRAQEFILFECPTFD